MVPPRPLTAFISLHPLEPVLVFSNPGEAHFYTTSFNPLGRIYDRHTDWVFLPLPEGLLRARTTRRGDVGFVFKSRTQAENWNREIRSVGTIYGGDGQGGSEVKSRTVYVGSRLI